MKAFGLMFILLCLQGFASAQVCEKGRVELQVLGAGGPELGDGMASSSYLIWLDGKSRILIDAGTGSSLNFEKAGGRIEELSAVAFTHLHIDHSADWPGYVKASYFTQKQGKLEVFGPKGNRFVPANSEFQQQMFGRVWPYMADHLKPSNSLYIQAHDIEARKNPWKKDFPSFSLSAINVEHGPIPALAWRVDIAGCSLVFSGDTNGKGNNLTRLSRRADLLVAHNAVPASASGAALNLHMPPSRIGEIAEKAGVYHLLLSHRMLRTLGRERETIAQIKKFYSGKVAFADDLQKVSLGYALEANSAK